MESSDNKKDGILKITIISFLIVSLTMLIVELSFQHFFGASIINGIIL